MDLEIIMPREVRKRKTNTFDITDMWNLKNDTSEHSYDIETDLQRTDLWLPRGKGEEKIGSLGLGDANYYIQDG